MIVPCSWMLWIHVAITCSIVLEANVHRVTRNQLQCYSCANMTSPDACATIHTCDIGQFCIVRRLGFDAMNRPLYEAFCDSELACLSLMLIGKRNSDCARCCDTDLCNNNCNAVGGVAPSIATRDSSVTIATTSAAVPSTTIKGNNSILQCYSCDIMIYPKQCEHTMLCQPGYMCLIRSTQYSTLHGGFQYKASCEKEAICKSTGLLAQTGQSTCAKCCSSDYCNNECNIATTTTESLTTTTRATTLSTTTKVASRETTIPSTTEIVTSTTSTTTITTPSQPATITPKVPSSMTESTTKPLTIQTSTTTQLSSTIPATATTPTGATTFSTLPTTATTTMTLSTKDAPTTASTSSTTTSSTTITMTTEPTSATTAVSLLHCYSCGFLDDPKSCRNSVKCGLGYLCLIRSTSFNTLHGGYQFKSSCERETLCKTAATMSLSIYNTCAKCCNTDNCNDECIIATQPTTASTTPVTTSTATVTTPAETASSTASSTTAATPSATTVATTSAAPSATTTKTTSTTTIKTTTPSQALSTTNPPPTTKPTSTPSTQTTTRSTTTVNHHPATPDPHLHCYACSTMVRPQDCSHVTICSEDEACFIYETENEHGILFHSKCNKKQVCDVLSHLPPTHNSHTGVELCHTCCSTNLCNNHCDFSHQPTTPLAPTRPPITTTTTAENVISTTLTREECEKHGYAFLPYIDLCFKLHFSNLTWRDAKHVCFVEGARLAVVDNDAKFSVLQSMLAFEKEYHNLMVYIGGSDVYSNGTYVWENGAKITSDFLHLKGVSQVKNSNCVVFLSSNHFALSLEDCQLHNPFICTKP